MAANLVSPALKPVPSAEQVLSVGLAVETETEAFTVNFPAFWEPWAVWAGWVPWSRRPCRPTGRCIAQGAPTPRRPSWCLRSTSPRPVSPHLTTLYSTAQGNFL